MGNGEISLGFILDRRDKRTGAVLSPPCSDLLAFITFEHQTYAIALSTSFSDTDAPNKSEVADQNPGSILG